MALAYGFVKAKVVSEPVMKGTRRKREIQYHQHFSVLVDGAKWDVAVNVGTNDADDLLRIPLAYDFHHPVIATWRRRRPARTCSPAPTALPALDFLRSDILAETGKWRPAT